MPPRLHPLPFELIAHETFLVVVAPALTANPATLAFVAAGFGAEVLLLGHTESGLPDRSSGNFVRTALPGLVLADGRLARSRFGRLCAA